MDRDRGGQYYSSSARMASAREDAIYAVEVSKKVREAKVDKPTPIHWFSASDFNPEIWKGVLTIYKNIFAPGQTIEKLDVHRLTELNNPLGGEVTYYPLRGKKLPFEVRSKVHEGRIVMRFKASDGNILGEDTKAEQFDKTVDLLLSALGVDLVTIGFKQN